MTSAEQHRIEYVRRVNLVTDHIDKNLHRPMALEELAAVAHFSRFHFHRIFASVVGETLNHYVQRLRIERAASRLILHPHTSITAIALECGFASSASFARTFRDAFEMSATQWRSLGESKRCETQSKIRIALSKPGKARSPACLYLESHNPIETWRSVMMVNGKNLEATVQVRDLKEHNVAYVRSVGPYGQAESVRQLFDKLLGWAGPHGHVNKATRYFSVAHDNPGITDEKKLRLSICLDVPVNTPAQGEVGTMRISGGKYAVARFEIEVSSIADAWDLIMGQWLPQSGFQMDDRHCYEEVIESPLKHPQGKIVLDICVPVKPLGSP